MSQTARGPLTLTLLLLAVAAPTTQAQGHSGVPASAAGIYSCIDDQGRRITSDRPIASCTAKEQRILNKDGSLKGVYPPILTTEERAEKEAKERKAAEHRAALADARRRDQNLLQRYPNEAAHRKARESALDNVRVALKSSDARLKALEAERQPLLNEAEFYTGKKLPAKLKSQIEANDAAAEAQREAAVAQQAELDRVNRFYDAELERLKLLWAGALPGTLGPIQAQTASQAPAIASPVAASASSVKASSLR